jgi:glycosyltransferase involved in cell wall biosynthesis
MSAFVTEVTPVVTTRDEAANIERSLRGLAWAREVIVIDNFSEDDTPRIASSFPNVRVIQRIFDNLATQWAFACAQSKTEWVLTLDADYIVPDDLAREIDALEPSDDAGAYEASFTYVSRGRPLRGSLYPPRAVLLRRGRYEFAMDGHTQRVNVTGVIRPLQHRALHDDRKPMKRFIARQRRYMRDEATKLRATPFGTLPFSGKIRKLRVVAPFAVVVQTLFVKRLVLDGWPGIHYAIERFIAECILSRELLTPSARSSDRP